MYTITVHNIAQTLGDDAGSLSFLGELMASLYSMIKSLSFGIISALWSKMKKKARYSNRYWYVYCLKEKQ